MRKGLRSGGEGVSFFFFQDIMTCLIGIVLFIALLLTLFANDSSMKGTVDSRGKPATVAQKTTLDHLIETIIKLKNELKAVNLSENSEVEIAQKVVIARAELEDLKGQLSKFSGSLMPTGGNAALKQSIDDIQQRTATRQAEVNRLALEEEGKNKTIADLTAKVTELEEKLLHEVQDTDHIWLDPTISTTTKKPILIQVNSDGFELMELGGATRSASKSGSNLEELLKSYQPTEAFAVIYFRPSTWNKYNSVTKMVKGLGFEIGTDGLDEKQKLSIQLPDS